MSGDVQDRTIAAAEAVVNALRTAAAIWRANPGPAMQSERDCGQRLAGAEMVLAAIKGAAGG
jgi:hypothetical protein